MSTRELLVVLGASLVLAGVMLGVLWFMAGDLPGVPQP